MKTYLRKPIKILQFPSRGKNKMLTELRNILAFSTISHLQAESRIEQEILHVIPVRTVIVP